MRFNLLLIPIVLVLIISSFVVVSATEQCPSSMISYWHFDESAGATLAKDYFNVNNLTVILPATFSQGQIGNALSVPTSSQFAQITSVPSNLQLQGDFTIEAWVNLTSFSNPSYIINEYIGTTKNYRVAIDQPTQKVIFYWRNVALITSSSTLNLNQWYHVAITRSNGNFILYINGINSGFASDSLNPTYSTDILKVGLLGTGLTDELAIYNTALDAGNISAHYINGLNYNMDYCYTATPANENGSSTDTNFNIQGCGSLTKGACSRDGASYCSNDPNPILYNTMLANLGCRGPDGINATSDDCCPSGYECSSAEGCVQRANSCDYWTSKGQLQCESHNCAWIDNNCKETNALSCSDYKNNQSCTKDTFNLGRTKGIGTDICTEGYLGNNKIVTASSCGCQWISNSCVFNYTVTDLIYFGASQAYWCQKNFTTGDCADGSQTIIWTVEHSAGISDSDLTSGTCKDGSMSIACGEKIVKLPFFSYVNFLFVFLGLVVFYFIRKKF